MKIIKTLLAAVLFASLSTQATAGADWHKYESKNFIVYSDYPKKVALKKVRRFELFKQSLHKLLNISESIDTVPFEVYLFKRERSLRKFTEKYTTSGFYRDRLGHPLMVVGPEAKDDIFFHEYVHFLTSRLGNFVYPRWYSEGIAEFYSTLEFKKDKAIIGRVPWGRRDWLVYEGMLPLDSLLEPGEKFQSSRFTGRFYATAWLLAHRMMLGAANGMEDYSGPLKEYLLRYTKGEKSADVFFEELGIDKRLFRNDLRRYAKKHSWNALSMPIPETAVKVETNALSNPEVINIQVRLAIAIGDWEYAEELLTKTPEALNSEGRAMLAIIEGHASEEVGDEARLIAELIEDHELNGAGHAYLGHALFDLAEKRTETRNALLTDALQHLELAREENALYGESTLLIRVYWALGRRPSAMNEISRLLKLNPASLSANLLAGEYSMKAEQYDNARFFLQRVVDWAHSEEQAKKALALLAEMDAIQLTAN